MGEGYTCTGNWVGKIAFVGGTITQVDSDAFPWIEVGESIWFKVQDNV